MVTYQHITTAFEIERVIKFISSVYVQDSYVKNVEEKSGASEYLNGPLSTTFLAQIKKEPVGTISLVGDSEYGLPMDTIYKDILSLLRDTKAQLAEVCQFAIDANYLTEMGVDTQNDVSLCLLALVIDCARKKKYTHLVFTINPKHRNFYEMLGAVQIGEERAYPAVNNAPALAYMLDMLALQDSVTSGTKKNFIMERIMTHVPECSE